MALNDWLKNCRPSFGELRGETFKRLAEVLGRVVYVMVVWNSSIVVLTSTHLPICANTYYWYLHIHGTYSDYKPYYVTILGRGP